VFNPFNFTDWADNLAEWYNTLLSALVLVLGQNAMPSATLFQDDWFLTTVGGTLGLAIRLVMAVVIVLGLYAMFRPTRSHSQWIGGLSYGIIVLMFFGVLVIPIYVALSMLSDVLIQVIAALSTGNPEAGTPELAEMLHGRFPDHFAGKLLSAGFSALFVLFSAAVAWAIHILVVVALIFYPLAAAFAGSKWGRRIIDMCNATIIMAVFVGPVMIFIYVLPSALPGSDNSLWRAIAMAASALMAFAVPLVLWLLALWGSSEITGRVTATIGNKIETFSSSPVSVNASIGAETDGRGGVVSTFSKMAAAEAASLALSKASKEDDGSDFRKKLSRIAIDSATAATAATGHPYIGAAIKGADKLQQARKNKQSEVTE